MTREVTDLDGTVLVLDFVDGEWERIFQGRGEKSAVALATVAMVPAKVVLVWRKLVVFLSERQMTTCPACGGIRKQYIPGSPHSPTTKRDPASGLVVRVDCVGHVLEILDAD